MKVSLSDDCRGHGTESQKTKNILLMPLKSERRRDGTLADDNAGSRVSVWD